MTMMLGGCSSTKDKVPTIQFMAAPLPPMPANLTRTIPDPGVRKDRDARVELARNRAWAKQLRDQHSATVVWYKKVRSVQR